MNNRTILCSLQSIAIALMLTLATTGTTLAAPGGGGHGGGGHVGGGRAYAGHFGGRMGAYGGRYGGLRGGYGYGGYGRYGGYGGYGGWGFGALGYGLFFGALPLYYSTLWWNDVPYYYADSNYYSRNAAAGEYETVRPAPGVESQATQEPTTADLFVYPKNDQNADQQARDRYECHRWATEQSGFGPTQPGGVPAPASTPAAGPSVAAKVAAPTMRQDYLRAQAACLEGRGYSVK